MISKQHYVIRWDPKIPAPALRLPAPQAEVLGPGGLVSPTQCSQNLGVPVLKVTWGHHLSGTLPSAAFSSGLRWVCPIRSFRGGGEGEALAFVYVLEGSLKDFFNKKRFKC